MIVPGGEIDIYINPVFQRALGDIRQSVEPLSSKGIVEFRKNSGIKRQFLRAGPNPYSVEAAVRNPLQQAVRVNQRVRGLGIFAATWNHRGGDPSIQAAVENRGACLDERAVIKPEFVLEPIDAPHNAPRCDSADPNAFARRLHPESFWGGDSFHTWRSYQQPHRWLRGRGAEFYAHPILKE